MSRFLSKSYPLRIHIASLFLALILLACGSISLLFYVKSRDMVITEMSKMIDRVVSETVREIERLFGPPETLAALFSKSAIARADNFDDRLQGLQVMHESLLTNPEIASIYLGYPNGEFFQFRRLLTDQDRRILEAPGQARWAVQSIDVQEDKTVSKQILFFNHNLEFLLSRQWQTTYDPRQRSWYSQAQESDATVRGSPYVFFTDRKLGLTFSRSLADNGAVAGVDIRLETLSEMMRQFKITPNTKVVLFGSDRQLIAHEDTDKLIIEADNGVSQIGRRSLGQLEDPVLGTLADKFGAEDLNQSQQINFKANGAPWLASSGKLQLDGGSPIFFSMVMPILELTAEVRKIRNQTVLLTLAIILALIPITLWVARGISQPISQLAGEANAVRRLDFSESDRVRSVIKEVDELSRAMKFMKMTISEFLLLIESLNREKNFDTLLERIGTDVRQAAAADGVLICLIDDVAGTLKPDVYCDANICSRDLDLPDFGLGENLPIIQAVKQNERLRWDLEPGQAATLAELIGSEGRQVTIWCEPLEDRQNTSMGVIGLIYRGSGGTTESSELQDRLRYVERLSGLAGVTLETKQLIQKQKELFDAFIKLIAGAIDAKSPYTGGHCQRVPEIAKMLAQAACDQTDGPLADFSLTDEQWEELHVAAWLHDCGKVTTPEFVVDKATKLETIYDRIHEVRMRFEVLKRDAEIKCWKSIAEGGSKEKLLDALKKELAQLDDDFEFIARCNEGGEFLADELIERIHEIAGRSWIRTLDDRIGISWEEGQRKHRSPAAPAPAEERLLSDRDEHLIARGDSDTIEPENQWGFKLDQPKHLYNRGEVYNLEVRRGTLSLEERFKINDHIVQTIKMLEELPYPRHLRNVPEIAGGHHETLHGTGYPRKLTGDQMSVTAKMMVIADVFEALTASDRPYKKAKKLSDAVHIMGMMQKGGHFDPDLYHLFLTSGIYRQYGEQYLDPSQIDDVDIRPYLDPSAAHTS
jgi:HD-GYP domain-containing protein (c-di-GMP phosphodiesterase class II)